MAVFYEYEYRGIMKNIHPPLTQHQVKVVPYLISREHVKGCDLPGGGTLRNFARLSRVQGSHQEAWHQVPCQGEVKC